MAENYRKELYDLNQRIQDDIARIVSDNDSFIKIPYFYYEDDIDEDIEVLIEDGYDVRCEAMGVNLTIEVINYCGYRQEIEVVGLKCHLGEVILISKDSNTHYLRDVISMYDLITIYEQITE